MVIIVIMIEKSNEIKIILAEYCYSKIYKRYNLFFEDITIIEKWVWL